LPVVNEDENNFIAHINFVETTNSIPTFDKNAQFSFEVKVGSLKKCSESSQHHVTYRITAGKKQLLLLDVLATASAMLINMNNTWE